MCVTLAFKLFGASIFFQGCMNADSATVPVKAEPPAAAIKSEDWAPLVAKADPEEDGSITYLFRDVAGRVRPAIATCADGAPKEADGKVMIAQMRQKDFTIYTVSCGDPPKVM
jgi:hypothetical protein